MYLQKVITKKDVRCFLDLPDRIYKNYPHYIKPRDQDIEEVFDPKKNKLFGQGKCERWLLIDHHDKPIGRIAAFFTTSVYRNELPTGGIGFFECINSQQAADYMFNYCKEWLKGYHIKGMDGPVNFGERMKWWGLLVKGFLPPLYGMNYHPPYYRNLFETYGFRVFFTQNCYSLDLRAKLPQQFYTIKDVITTHSSYELRQFDKNNMPRFAKDFVTIYNQAWKNHGEEKELDEKEMRGTFKKMLPVIDEKAVWFAYHNRQPIGFWINLPNLNEYFVKVNSRFGWFSVIKFLWLKKFCPTKKLVGIVFGVIPEFQNKGVDVYMIAGALETIKRETAYRSYEIQWVGDFNPKMLNIIKKLNGEITRSLITYRYIFDRNEAFAAHSKI